MRYDLLIDQMEWSYSRITLFEDCPYCWMQKYIYNVDTQPKFFAQYGRFMHDILRRHFAGELARNELAAYYLMHFRDEVTGRPPSQKIYDAYFEQGRQYLKALSLPERKILKVEQEMHFEFAGHPFVGFLDLLSEDSDGTLYLTDHKSRALKPRSNRAKPTVSDLELDQYLRQLYLYAHAVHQLYGRYPDYLEFNCFRNGEWITEPFKKERLQEVEAWAASRIDEITRTDEWLPALDFWYCKHLCDTSAECEYEELL